MSKRRRKCEESKSMPCVRHSTLNSERAVFHRPHPEKETDKGAVKAMRRFLENAGVKYDEL